MARPISWLPRLHEIRRAVSSSVRSHYTRRELEGLFQLQPRAALKVIELLPTVSIGTSLLVEKEALLSFLQGVKDTDDVTTYCERLRLAKAAVSHRKIRSLVRKDLEPLAVSSLPDAICLSRGRLEVTFATVEELAEAMYALARTLDSDLDRFASAYEVQVSQDGSPEPDELAHLFKELERLESSYRVPLR